MDHSYPKKEKLKSKKRIDQLFIEGKSITSFPLRLMYLEDTLPEGVNIQAGVAVSKRRFKSAVKRNRVKRLLRESYRINKQLVNNNSHKSYAFLILYIGKIMPKQEHIDTKLKSLLEKFNAQTHEKIG